MARKLKCFLCLFSVIVLAFSACSNDEYESYVESTETRILSVSEEIVQTRLNSVSVYQAAFEAKNVCTVYFIHLSLSDSEWDIKTSDEKVKLAEYYIQRCYKNASSNDQEIDFVVGTLPMGYIAFTDNEVYGYKELTKEVY